MLIYHIIDTFQTYVDGAQLTRHYNECHAHACIHVGNLNLIIAKYFNSGFFVLFKQQSIHVLKTMYPEFIHAIISWTEFPAGVPTQMQRILLKQMSWVCNFWHLCIVEIIKLWLKSRENMGPNCYKVEVSCRLDESIHWVDY